MTLRGLNRKRTVALGASILAILIVIIIIAGCSKQPGLQAADENTPADQQLPFDRTPDKNGVSPTAAFAPSEIPAGTPMTIRLQSTLSSASSRAGDAFQAVLDEPIVVQEKTIAPRGATVTGKVLDAKASGRLQDSGYLRLALTALSFDGRSLPIQTSSVFAKGGSHEKRNLAMIGGGAGAGALIGGIAGGGKGALIGTAVGAAGGTGAAYATGQKDVEFGAERRLTFRLTQPLALPR
jgi:hypothetical protein